MGPPCGGPLVHRSHGAPGAGVGFGDFAFLYLRFKGFGVREFGALDFGWTDFKFSDFRISEFEILDFGGTDFAISGVSISDVGTLDSAISPTRTISDLNFFSNIRNSKGVKFLFHFSWRPSWP